MKKVNLVVDFWETSLNLACRLSSASFLNKLIDELKGFKMLNRDLIEILKTLNPDKEIFIDYDDWNDLFTDGSYNDPVESAIELSNGIYLLPKE